MPGKGASHGAGTHSQAHCPRSALPGALMDGQQGRQTKPHPSRCQTCGTGRVSIQDGLDVRGQGWGSCSFQGAQGGLGQLLTQLGLGYGEGWESGWPSKIWDQLPRAAGARPANRYLF